MSIDLSFIGQGIPPLNTSQGEPVAQDDNISRVQSIMDALGPIMSSMERSPVPTPPSLPPLPNRLQQFGGSIGDALLAFAQARLGHSPQPGPFATGMEKTEQQRMALQQKYQESLAAQAAADRNERNRVRAAAGQIALRSQGAIDLARVRMQGQAKGTAGYLTDEEGNRRLVNIRRNGQGQIIGVDDIGESNFAPFIQPAIPGVSAPERIPRAGRPGPIGNIPPPPPEIVNSLAQDVAQTSGIDEMMDAYNQIRKVAEGQSFPEQVLKTWAGETRYGGKLSPEYAAYTVKRRGSLNSYIKAQTGAQFSVKEMTRYEGQYPEPWDSEELAQQKSEALKQRALADMKAKLAAYPGAKKIIGNEANPGRKSASQFVDEYLSGGSGGNQ